MTEITDVRYDVHMILINQEARVLESFDLPIWRLNDSLFHDDKLFIFEHEFGTTGGRKNIYLRHSTVYLKDTLLTALKEQA